TKCTRPASEWPRCCHNSSPTPRSNSVIAASTGTAEPTRASAGTAQFHAPGAAASAVEAADEDDGRGGLLLECDDVRADPVAAHEVRAALVVGKSSGVAAGVDRGTGFGQGEGTGRPAVVGQRSELRVAGQGVDG